MIYKFIIRFVVNTKVTLIIGCLLFCLSLFFRLSSSVDTQVIPSRPILAYQHIGTGADPDYQMSCGLFYSQRSSLDESITHYDYLFLCPLIGTTFLNFSFSTSLLIFTLAIAISGAVVSTFPFLYFQLQRETFSIGGLIASLLLIINQEMIYNSDSRLLIYPLVALFFVGYLFTFFRALKTKNMFWLVAFGTMAVLQSLSKPFMYANDIPFMIILPVILLIENFKFKKIFPFVDFYITPGWLKRFKYFVPSTIYFSGIIAFELLFMAITNGYFFLGDLFLNNQGPSTKDVVLQHSLLFEGTSWEYIQNLLSITIEAVRELVLYFPWVIIFMGMATLLMLIKRKKPIVWFASWIIFLSISTLGVYLLIQKILILNIYVPTSPTNIRESLLLAIMAMFFVYFSLMSKKHLLATLIHVFYFGSLALTLGAVNQPQLFVTVIIWMAVLIGMAIDESLSFVLFRSIKRIKVMSFIFVMLIFSPIIFGHFSNSAKSIIRFVNEVKYLQWVNEQLPAEAYVMGGAGDNFILLNKIIDRPLFYNSFSVARLYRQNVWVNEVDTTNFIPIFVSENVSSEMGSNLFVLDEDIGLWTKMIESGPVETYPKGKFKLVEFATDPNTKRKIYSLGLNNNYVPPVEEK